jgi:hypothetical protein
VIRRVHRRGARAAVTAQITERISNAGRPVTLSGDRGGLVPEPLREWTREHQALLDAVFEAFVREAAWPDPVALDRRLRSEGTRIGLVSAVDGMPRELGWRECSPPRAQLTFFGVACASGAQWLLERYVDTLRLALSR